MRSPATALAALAVLAGAAAPAHGVVGGAPLPIAQAPYQVAVYADGALCGGALLDGRHVATAAHCVVNDDGQRVKSPAKVVVRLGHATRSLATAHAVDRVAVLPDYDGVFRLDAAVLRLAAPLTLTPGSVEWLAPAATPPGAGELFVSGWGDTTGAPSSTTLPADLRGVAVTNRADADCTAMFGSAYDGPTMVCAGDTLLQRPGEGRDSCGGDSGGPLTDGTAASRGTVLHGIVSFGPAWCGQGYGAYTQVAAPAVRDFLVSDPPDAPRPGGVVAVTGLPRTGTTLTCDPGAWTGSPVLTFQVLAQSDGGWVALTAPGASPTWTPAPADAGRVVVCSVEGRNAGGRAVATSTPVQIAEGPAEAAPPVEAPPVVPPVAPPPDEDDPAAEDAGPAPDLSPPVARVVRASCTRASCALRVRVVDAAPSSGVRAVGVRVRSTGRGGRPRTRQLVASARRDGTYGITARRLGRGRHRFTVVAVDGAGNLQPVPTVRALRVR